MPQFSIVGGLAQLTEDAFRLRRVPQHKTLRLSNKSNMEVILGVESDSNQQATCIAVVQVNELSTSTRLLATGISRTHTSATFDFEFLPSLHSWEFTELAVFGQEVAKSI